MFLFDVLLLNGKPLLNEPYEKRRQLLEENVRVIENRVELAEVHRFTVDEKVFQRTSSLIPQEKFEALLDKILKEGRKLKAHCSPIQDWRVWSLKIGYLRMILMLDTGIKSREITWMAWLTPLI